MPSATRELVDGEYINPGTLEEQAEIFYDVSGDKLIIAVPSGKTISFDVAATAEMTLSATILDLASVDLKMQAGGQILDDNGNELIEFVETASAVNGFRFVNAATGNNPTITNEGEADTGLTLSNYDGTNTEELIILDPVPSAVNEIKGTNAATGTPPIIAAQGGYTNVSLRLTAKGTGVIQTTQPLVEEMTQTALTD